MNNIAKIFLCALCLALPVLLYGQVKTEYYQWTKTYYKGGKNKDFRWEVGAICHKVSQDML